MILSKLPEHALGLEVGGKRKGKCKPLLKSPRSTSTEAKLKPFSFYDHLIPTIKVKKKKKKKLQNLCNPSLGGGKMQSMSKLGEAHRKIAVQPTIKLMLTGQKPSAPEEGRS